MTQKELEFRYESSPTFEIDLVVRDAEGKPRRRKTFRTDSGYKLWSFYQRHQGKPRRKKKKGDPKKLPDASQADKIMKEMYQDKDTNDKRSSS